MGSVHRFPSMRKFLQYAGCAPANYDSGNTHRPGHLSKRVNVFLKRRFVWAGKALCHTVKRNSDLKEYARAQLNLHWAKKERKLAWANVGIKVARLIYILLKTGRTYDRFYESNKSSSGSAPDNSRATTSPETITQPEDAIPEFTRPPVPLHTLRKRTRQFARYVEDVLEGESGEWYADIAKYFTQLADGAKRASETQDPLPQQAWGKKPEYSPRSAAPRAFI